jgi:hypothetical protein
MVRGKKKQGQLALLSHALLIFKAIKARSPLRQSRFAGFRSGSTHA